MTLINLKIIAETRSYISRWRSRFRRRRVCLSSLMSYFRLIALHPELKPDAENLFPACLYCFLTEIEVEKVTWSFKNKHCATTHMLCSAGNNRSQFSIFWGGNEELN